MVMIPGDFLADELLANVHRVILLVKRWLLGTHQGAISTKHLQHYPEEFAFRHNRRMSQHVGKIFYRMLQGATATEAKPYWELVGRSSRNWTFARASEDN